MKQTEPNVVRLRKLLLIALSVQNDSQAASACRAINRELAKAGKDKHWFAEQFDKPPPPWLLHPIHTANPADMLTFLCEDVSVMMLNDRELEFVMNMNTRFQRKRENFRLTEKQARWLKGIYERLKLVRTS